MTDAPATTEPATGSRPAPDPPRVSVIIPTFNRAPYLARALDALREQTLAASAFEVIVVDDGSSDDTAAVLARAWPLALRSVRQTNQGPAAARNAGIALARAEIILFIDDDVVPAPDLVARHLQAHAEPGRVVIGRMAPPLGRQPFWAEWELRTLERQYAQMVGGIFEPTPRQFYTANASVRRADLERAGMFDVRYRRAEDVELAYRLEEGGATFVFLPDACVLHDTPRSFSNWMAMAGQYGQYDVLLSRQGGRRWTLDILAEEFVEARHPALQAVARLTVGHRRRSAAVRRLAPLAIGGADALRLRRVALAGCGALFNLLYWHAFCEEFGGRVAFWDAVRTSRATRALSAAEAAK
ncbi:MAG: glycosyltransferase family 2 protein [Dehalococcoidia bacterium]|nr:glycosyltransferase family 2 protein [Dehalococcoidia bacterium]